MFWLCISTFVTLFQNDGMLRNATKQYKIKFCLFWHQLFEMIYRNGATYAKYFPHYSRLYSYTETHLHWMFQAVLNIQQNFVIYYEVEESTSQFLFETTSKVHTS
jgi:hypothetical protein